METIKKAKQQDPDATSLKLTSLNLKEIDTLMDEIKEMEKLEELDLSNNKIEALPVDLSSLANLNAIFLKKNSFANIEDVANSLKTLPKLKKLEIELKSNEEAEIILTALPDLEMLNGETIEKEDEDGNEDDQAQVSSEKEEKKQATDEKDGKEEERKVKEEKKDQNLKIRKIDELTEAGNIFDLIRTMRKKIEPKKDQQLDQEFKKRMGSIITGLKKSFAENIDGNKRNAKILKAKHSLLDISFGKMVETGTTKQTIDIWTKIKNGYDDVIEGLYEITQAKDEAIQAVPEEKVVKEKEEDKKQDIIISEKEAEYERKAEEYKKQIESAQMESKELILKFEELEKKFNTTIEERDKLREEFEKEKAELALQVESLEAENKKYLETIIKHSKGVTTMPSKSMLVPSSPRQIQEHSNSPPGDKKPKAFSSVIMASPQARTLALKPLKELIQDIFVQKVKFDEKCTSMKQPKQTMEQYMYTYLNQRYGLKSIIIEWASGLINGVRTYSVEDCDVALFGKILQNECEEEYRQLHQKIKSTMGEILRSKIKAKKKFKTEADLIKMVEDVQNGFIEEPFWRAIISKMYNEKDNIVLEERIKTKIAERAQSAMKVDTRKLTREELAALQSKKEGQLLYQDLQKILLTFQLSEHEKYLKKFSVLFRKCDADTNGVLNEEEFRGLISMMNVFASEEEVNRILGIIDPFNNKQITFSECVTLFTNEILPELKNEQGEIIAKELPILDRFLIEDTQGIILEAKNPSS